MCSFWRLRKFLEPFYKCPDAFLPPGVAISPGTDFLFGAYLRPMKSKMTYWSYRNSQSCLLTGIFYFSIKSYSDNLSSLFPSLSLIFCRKRKTQIWILWIYLHFFPITQWNDADLNHLSSLSVRMETVWNSPPRQFKKCLVQHPSNLSDLLMKEIFD